MSSGMVKIGQGSWEQERLKVRRNFQRIASTVLGPEAISTHAGIYLTDLTANALIYPDGDKLLTSLGVATDGQIPIGSTGTTPVLATISGTANEIDVTNAAGSIIIGLINPLIVAKGGSGAATFTDHSILLGSGTAAFTALGEAANGQIPIGSVGADPVLATITGTTNQVLVANAAGSITVSLPQDYDTGASPILANLSLGTGELTCGSINRATGTLTIEIGDTAEISITSTAVTLGGNLIIPDGGTIGSVSDIDVITIDASGNTTFTVFPITPSAAPDADYEVANKKYVDDNAGADSEKVKIDSGATADYIGAANSDGVLRTGTSMSYTDGGNFVTVNTIQDIRTTDAPTFAGLNISTVASLPETVVVGKIIRLTTDDNLYLGRKT